MNTRRIFLRQAGLGLIAAPVTKLVANLTVEKTGEIPGFHTQAAVSNKLVLNVRDFGATGNGQTMDTVAIQQTIDRCSVLGGGEVLVPAGNYLTGSIALRSNINLHLEQDAVITGSSDLKDYPVTQVRWEGKWIQGYTGLIYAIGARNIGIKGPGKIVGSNAVGGRPGNDNPLRRPALIEPIDCTDIVFDGFSTQYHVMWSIHLTYCERVSIKNLTIRSTGPNGDGIDVDSCKNVLIDSCDISTGDDCISLKSGRGMEGYTLLRTTEDVHITNCTFADAIFACIGIGSETSGGIRNVLIDRCKFTEAKSFAIYIKSNIGRGAFIEDITANNLEVSGAKQGFIRFNIMGSGLQDQIPVTGDEGIPTTRNFKFTNIKVSDVPVLIDGTGIHPHKPLDGLILDNITGTCEKGISLANIKNADIKQINVTGYTGPLLRIYNVTGKGLNGAAILPTPKLIEPLPAGNELYNLH